MTNHPDPPPTTHLEDVFECALRQFEDDLDQAASRTAAPLSEILRRAGLTDLLPALSASACTDVAGDDGNTPATSAAGSLEGRDEDVEYAADAKSIDETFRAPMLRGSRHPSWARVPWDRAQGDSDPGDGDPGNADHIGHEETLFALVCRDLARGATMPPGHAAISALGGQWIARWIRHHDKVSHDEESAPGPWESELEAEHLTADGRLGVDAGAGRLGRVRVEPSRWSETWIAYDADRVDQGLAAAVDFKAAWIPAWGAALGDATSRGYERLWNLCARALDVVVVVVGDPLAAGAAEVMTRWANPQRDVCEVHQAPGAAALRFRSDDLLPGESDPAPKEEFASFVEAVVRMSNCATGGTLMVLGALADRPASCITKPVKAPGLRSRVRAGTRYFLQGPTGMVKVMLYESENKPAPDIRRGGGKIVPMRALANRQKHGPEETG